jgi:hypothetical protein
MIASVLIIAAISLTIGYIVGWLLATLRGDKQSSKSTKAKAPGAETLADHRIMLRVWRNNKSGGLLIDLRGTQQPEAKELSLDARRELFDLLKEIGIWMGLPAENAPLQRSPAAEGAISPAAGGAGVTTAGLISPVESEVVKPSILDGMTNVIADVVSPVPLSRRDAPKSIVQQIDEIFQEKLLGTKFEGQKIYISEDIRKGVIVWIGNTMYEGVGSMPEGEVKNLLRASVNEWERLQEQARRRIEKS